jgi:phosphoserine phosphatase
VPTAEVDAGQEGPNVGAFFDLDGTLVAGYTAAAHTRDRVRRGDLRVVEFLTIVQLAVQFRLLCGLLRYADQSTGAPGGPR